MAYSQFTLVLAPVPLSNSVHTQYHVCVYTTCKGREMCMHKIQLVYTRVVLCVWPQNYLCMSTNERAAYHFVHPAYHFV